MDFNTFYESLETATVDNVTVGHTIIIKKDDMGPQGNPLKRDYFWVGFVGSGDLSDEPKSAILQDIERGIYKVLKVATYEINESNYESEAIKELELNNVENMQTSFRQDGYYVTWLKH